MTMAGNRKRTRQGKGKPPYVSRRLSGPHRARTLKKAAANRNLLIKALASKGIDATAALVTTPSRNLVTRDISFSRTKMRFALDWVKAGNPKKRN